MTTLTGDRRQLTTAEDCVAGLSASIAIWGQTAYRNRPHRRDDGRRSCRSDQAERLAIATCSVQGRPTLATRTPIDTCMRKRTSPVSKKYNC